MKYIVSLILISAFVLFIPPLFIFTDSRIITDRKIWVDISKKKSEPLRQIITDLQKGHNYDWISAAAPVVWWHPKEIYKAVDPIEATAEAEMWYREVKAYFPFITEKEVDLGPADISTAQKISYDGFNPYTEITRLFEFQGIKHGLGGFELRYDSNKKLVKPAPLFWRLSLSPLFKEIQNADPNRVLVPIEFWYFMTYNPVDIYFGNHAGDWESFMVVFDVHLENKVITSTPLYTYTSAHAGGSWTCSDQLEFKNGRLQLYSGLGTHATYTKPGVHWRIYPDRTARGSAWDSSRYLRPLVQEPYYGFSGSWGATSFIHWMNAPLAPGPDFKYLPASGKDKALEDWHHFIETYHQH
jgi:hypothetical protein